METDPITIWASTDITQTTRERLAELIRSAGIEWKRANDPHWRDKPWKDGVVIDLDDVDGFIADYIIEHADPRADVEEAPPA